MAKLLQLRRMKKPLIS